MAKKQPFIVHKYYKKNCVKIMDEIVKATNESDLVKISKKIGWPLDATVTAWCLWKMIAAG